MYPVIVTVILYLTVMLGCYLNARICGYIVILVFVGSKQWKLLPMLQQSFLQKHPKYVYGFRKVYLITIFLIFYISQQFERFVEPNSHSALILPLFIYISFYLPPVTQVLFSCNSTSCLQILLLFFTHCFNWCQFPSCI